MSYRDLTPEEYLPFAVPQSLSPVSSCAHLAIQVANGYNCLSGSVLYDGKCLCTSNIINDLRASMEYSKCEDRARIMSYIDNYCVAWRKGTTLSEPSVGGSTSTSSRPTTTSATTTTTSSSSSASTPAATPTVTSTVWATQTVVETVLQDLWYVVDTRGTTLTSYLGTLPASVTAGAAATVAPKANVMDTPFADGSAGQTNASPASSASAASALVAAVMAALF